MTASPLATRPRISSGAEALVLGDLDHLRGDDPFARGFNLSHVGSTSEQNAPGYDKVAEMQLESSL